MDISYPEINNKIHFFKSEFNNDFTIPAHTEIAMKTTAKNQVEIFWTEKRKRKYEIIYSPLTIVFLFIKEHK